MNGTGLETIGWALLAMTVGAAIGWLAANRRSRLRSIRSQQETDDRIQQAKAEANAQSCSLRKARSRVQELEANVADLEAKLANRHQKVAGLQAQVIDRESTIDSLRSRLYGARISTSLLEEELDALQHRSRATDTGMTKNSPAATSTSSLTISLGDGLEIQTSPAESQSIGGI